MVKLKIKDDEGQTTTVSLTRDEYTVGRKEGNTIRLTAENVSRTHARLIKKGAEVHIEDLSKYGIRVNGERISAPRRLSDGDVVMIGDYALSLEGSEALKDPDAAPKPAATKAETEAKPAVDKEPAPREPTGVGIPSPLEKAAKAQIAAAKAAVSEKTSVGAAVADDKDKKGGSGGKGKGKKRLEASHPTLVAVNSQLAGTVYPISGETMILGRTGENDLVVEHHSISRNHAKLVVKDGKVTMVDLESKNGIRVNGEFWEESVLKSGDIVELGKVQFRFVEKDEDFIYRPEDWTEAATGAAAADKAPEKKGGKTWILFALVGLVGGLVAVYFLALKEPSVPNVEATATATTPGATATTPPTPETVPPAETQPTQPPEVVKQDNAEAVNQALDKAKAAIAAEKWEDADKQVQVVLALDRENPQGKRLADKIVSERSASAAFAAAQAAQAKGELQIAWAELEKVKDLPADSSYAARLNELRSVLGPAIANSVIDQAKEALGKKRYDEAIRLATDALAIAPGNAEAEDVKAKAKKARDAAKPPETKAPETKPPTTKPPTTAPPVDAGGKSGKDLYQEARAIHNSDAAGALKLYQQAATKGYTAAYKQIGSVQIQLGNTAEAIKAYNTYIKLNPTARDRDTIRDIVLQLGGTPPP